MKDRLAVSIDIGSTFTKGALFRLNGDAGTLEARENVPTTSADLAEGFEKVLRAVVPLSMRRKTIEETAAALPVYYSSSAKGGLSVTACGIVPELTAEMAERAALSAGGRVVSVYAYKLSPGDLGEINRARPDILLLTGGTDGGNETYPLYNASVLRELYPGTVLIYAGNRKIRGRVLEALAGRECIMAENVLPALDSPAPEDAGGKIRAVFLDKITAGKGLDTLSAQIGRAPNPTPYAVLQWVRTASDFLPELGGFLLADMGGATTDIYSSAEETEGGAGVIRRGLREPEIKRTVEGDLGLRVTAAFAAEKIHAPAALGQYAADVSRTPSFLPDAAREKAFDLELALGILGTALVRHAGTVRTVYTALGAAAVIKGKDLRNVKSLIGSGGYLSKLGSAKLRIPAVLSGPSGGGGSAEQSLLPRHISYIADRDYLIPLAANLVFDYPAQAAFIAADHFDTACPETEVIHSWN